MPGFELTFAPTDVHVSSGSDMAYEIGTYSLGFNGSQGPVKDEGKYVVVWKKDGDAWKAAADIFNSNGAPK
jgi:ketosteroid isomerase-like protein